MLSKTMEPINRQAAQSLSRGQKGKLDTIEQAIDAVFLFLQGEITHRIVRKEISRGAEYFEWRIVLRNRAKQLTPQPGWDIKCTASVSTMPKKVIHFYDVE